jgi:hypothetical protein
MSVRPDVGLERLIHGLEQELLGAPDEEFVAGARDLGMKPEMKGSAAFAGVKNFSPQLLAALLKAYNAYHQRPHPEAPSETADTEADPDAAAPGRAGTPKRNADA